MEIKDNVYALEDGTKTGQSTAVEGNARGGAKEKGSAVLGKFKDVSALERAYETLQAEFTRRSQRLKELERAAENFKAEQGVDGAEKLRKNAGVRKERTKEFDGFVAEIERGFAVEPKKDDGKPTGGTDEKVEAVETVKTDENTQTDGASTVGDGNNVPVIARSVEDEEEKVEAAISADDGIAENNIKKASFDVADGAISDETLYRKALENESVRLKIIGDYLSSVGKTGAPLTMGASGTLATPPLKARSVSEAGEMALRFFKTAK